MQAMRAFWTETKSAPGPRKRDPAQKTHLIAAIMLFMSLSVTLPAVR